MCLGIPMQVGKIEGEMATVQAAGLRQRANIQLLPQIKLGDYVIVHAGFAIEIIDPRKALETLRIVSEIH
ncbi:MAG: HypC/HybG/HupF family hydrogenase formation chaperone [Candidatus Omnitrophica bacterium]|nr:HypC/HybG/HupF family hydrogenase formation chaperone [Candidatus Omnitrophota bacterium]MDD5655021.1 HypC/HybG/HupF family hydrogenase formation chaperone [Candidatus Omnitrophota bacterium]